MSPLSLPIPPREATKYMLSALTTRRMRDVLEKRFGLKGGKKKTLDAIGKEYKITRERVRQIEAEALRQVRKPEALREVAPLMEALKEHMRAHGGVMPERQLFATLADERSHPHVAFLLDVGNSFHVLPEDESHTRRWTMDKNAAEATEKIMTATVRALEEKNACVSENELDEMIAHHAREALGGTPDESVRRVWLSTSRVIRKNPYGEYGLSHWPFVTPSGVKDKAYVALVKTGHPLHFKDVAGAINTAGWSNKRAHPQTVHNELIKDSRFVLVGRGLYALREWGYEPGPVRDVLVSIFREKNRPLEKEEIITSILERRLVKTPTILLNLQNRSLFKRTEDGKYTLV
ncbi:MAG: hypothetical protein G01um101433_639 [Parcubacteria group bacterium Gr01-1014_33]|nr:MAG: hypothetical protein G01um101433_639 [Parcubacteria group bacterium Gr01-1014_33]